MFGSVCEGVEERSISQRLKVKTKKSVLVVVIVVVVVILQYKLRQPDTPTTRQPETSEADNMFI